MPTHVCTAVGIPNTFMFIFEELDVKGLQINFCDRRQDVAQEMEGN